MKYAWNDTINIFALFELPEKEIDDWFPFSIVLPECSFGFSFEQEQQIRAEGRLVVKTLEHVRAGDGEDDCEIQTVWFDGKPFAVLRRNGRHGRDRWVTHPAELCKALMYLVECAAAMLEADDYEDYQDPAEEFPVDRIFVGLLEEKFVIPEALPPKDSRFKRALTALDDDEEGLGLIVSKTDSPPALLRRGKGFVRYERPLTEAESVAYARVLAPGSLFEREGFTHIFVYRYIARPENYQEAVVF